MRKLSAFTLIELLIVIVIFAILAAIAVPTYNTYVTKSNRSEAMKTLLSIQLEQEKYRTTHDSYGNLAQVWDSTQTENGYYDLSMSNVSATSYTITATAQGRQTSDTGCSTLTLSYSNGTTTRSPTDCWN